MKEITKQIAELIKKPMEALGIIVHNVEYITENNYNFLKITLDKVNGIDLDAIVEATKTINPIIDKYDLIKEEYILDISSKERG
ncbi:MAG: hypothetical protein PHD03_01845 [Bacilli bacterium]|nr:hypothetical protein [Bacilli bacterium]MDD4406876.1 hypothetical protein [Bacilli bacterium]